MRFLIYIFTFVINSQHVIPKPHAFVSVPMQSSCFSTVASLYDIISTNPEMINDILQFLVFIILTIRNYIDIHNEEDGDRQDKGKGKATAEQQKEWDRELEENKPANLGDSNDDDGDDNKGDNKIAQIKADEELAKKLQSGFDENLDDINPIYNRIDNSGSLSSYSVVSTEINSDDDNARANLKLDLAELDEKLLAEKLEKDGNLPVSKKRNKDDNDKDEPSPMPNKRSKK